MESQPVIALVGSLNVDYTLRVPWIPVVGETLIARGAARTFGGKGANQAIAAARSGAAVRMIGCVGGDDSGKEYIAHLAAEGIDTSNVHIVDRPTGSAFIAVDDAAENCIIVDPGANQLLTTGEIEKSAEAIRTAALLLVQLECPWPAVQRAIAIACEAGVPTIVNPSPWSDEFRKLKQEVDVLIVNEVEATALTRADLITLTRSFKRLLASRCKTLIVTRGADSTLVFSKSEGSFEINPPKISPVDTVGAGDVFAGTFAATSAMGNSLREAVVYANTAAAMSTLLAGAQSAIPTRSQVLAFSKSQGKPRRTRKSPPSENQG